MKPHLPLLFTLVAACPGFGSSPAVSQESFPQFLAAFEGKVVPLSREAAIASFDASVSGKEADYARSEALQVQLKQLYADPAAFAKLKTWRDSKTVTDPLQKRQLELLYLGFLGNQLPEALLTELVKRQTAIEKTFNTFRASIDGKPHSDNELDAILREATDTTKVEKAWKASKEIGGKVALAIVELVKLRNGAARTLGFKNFQAMQLALGEQDPDEIERLFDQLDRLTRRDYAQAKNEVDTFLARRFGIAKAALKPWHYQDRFFQEAPQIYPVSLDDYYAGKDLTKLGSHYYASLGMPIDDILARSDLFEKPGKYQHAFSSDIDRAGDVRILCSLKPNAYWMNTLLHEAGHGVYSKFNDPALPWLLRDSAHAFTTEAIANLFGRFASSPAWLQDSLGISAAERAEIEVPMAKTLRLEQLVFSRWSQVMFRFEKAMYENPDQDLDKLWWNLVERYQLLKRPEGRRAPDWASKIHVALYPAYYHNYLMGQLLASQLLHDACSRVLKSEDIASQSFAGKQEIGRYFIEHIFKPGMRYPWNEMIERATGEKLTPKYYAEQFIGK